MTHDKAAETVDEIQLRYDPTIAKELRDELERLLYNQT